MGVFRLLERASKPRLEGIFFASLTPDELAAFRAWFEAFEAERFDERIERDAKSGKLDQLAERAMAVYRAGRPASAHSDS